MVSVWVINSQENAFLLNNLYHEYFSVCHVLAFWKNISNIQRIIPLINHEIDFDRLHLSFFTLEVVSLNSNTPSWNIGGMESALSFILCTVWTIFHRMKKSLNSEITIKWLTYSYRFCVFLFFCLITWN